MIVMYKDDSPVSGPIRMVRIVPDGIPFRFSEREKIPEDEMTVEIPGTDLLMSFEKSCVYTIAGKKYHFGIVDIFKTSQGWIARLTNEECSMAMRFINERMTKVTAGNDVVSAIALC